MARRKKTRGGGEQYVKLTYYFLKHPSWLELSSNAQLILIELRRRYNGHNNGQISLSCREAGKVAKCSKDTANRALLELEYYSHVKRRKVGTFESGQASEYILTCEPYNGQPATNDWKHSRPRLEKITRHNVKDVESRLKDRKAFMEAQIVSPEGL